MTTTTISPQRIQDFKEAREANAHFLQEVGAEDEKFQRAFYDLSSAITQNFHAILLEDPHLARELHDYTIWVQELIAAT